jgi:hypothetical protein
LPSCQQPVLLHSASLGEQCSEVQFLSSGIRVLQRAAQVLNMLWQELAAAIWKDFSIGLCACTGAIDRQKMAKAATSVEKYFIEKLLRFSCDHQITMQICFKPRLPLGERSGSCGHADFAGRGDFCYFIPLRSFGFI